MNLKLKRIAITILGILLTLSIAMSLAFYNNTKGFMVSADIIEKSDIAESSYVINQRQTFPTSTTVDVGGEQVVASKGVLIFPNGVTYTINQNQIFILDVIGEYTLKYFNNDLTVYDKFVVTDKLYSLSDNAEGNSITEFTLTDENKDIVYKNMKSNVTVARGYYGNHTDPTKGSTIPSENADGLIVRMKQGTKFTYAEPIDLNDTSEDGITNILSFSLMNTEYYDDNGVRYDQASSMISAAQKIAKHTYITLTDCYDPNRYIQFMVLNSDTNYARVSTNEMSSKAIWAASFWDRTGAGCKQVFYGSERSVVFTDMYGTSASTTSVIRGYNSKLHLRYDNEKGIVYWGAEQNTKIKGGTTSAADMRNVNHNLVMDIKDPAVTDGVVFPGFTTGEVYLSVHFADAFVNESARIDIYSIGNKNATDIINAPKTYTDTKAPIIEIESNPTINGGVYAKVGEEFTIPSAKATDINLKGNVAVNVYRGYNTNRVSAVKVENGKFDIATNDVYYIVYTATDFYGNRAEKVFKVYGVSGQEIISFDSSAKIANNTPIMTETLFPLGEKVSTLNNYADLKLKIEFISDKESFVFADLKNGDEIDAFWAENNYFITTYAGTYKVRFTFADNAVSSVSEYEFTTVPSNVITFASKPFINRILMKDATYNFETVDAIKYINGAPEFAGKAQLQIKFDNGSFQNIQDLDKVVITGSKTAQLKAVYGEYSILSDVAVITDVNYAAAKSNGGRGLNGANYFYYEDGAFELPDDRDLLYVSTNGELTNTLKFANMINFNSLNISYQIHEQYSNFEKVKFVFTDPYQPENVLELALYKKAGSVYFSYNGIEVKLTDNFSSEYDKTFDYSAKSGVLSFSGATKSYVPNVYFSTPLAYFDIVLEGIRGDAGIMIKKINGQSMTKTVRDNRGPDLISEFMIGHYGVGDVITLPSVMFVDVLSTIKLDSISTSFKYERTDVQTALDGTVLDGIQNDPSKDYQVKINAVGEYRYYFDVTDEFGNDNGSYMIINSVDKVAPVIKFKGQIKADVIVKIKVGETIKLNFSVSDDVTPTEKIVTTILMMDYRNSILYPVYNKSIKFEQAGKFYVSIVSQDLANNVAFASFEVIVSE